MRLLILLPYCICHSISHHIANVVPNTVAVVAMFVCVYSCMPRLARVAIVASQGGQGTEVACQNAHDGSTSATARISLQFNPKVQSITPPRIWICLLLCFPPVPVSGRLHGRPHADLRPMWRHYSISPFSYPSLMPLNQGTQLPSVLMQHSVIIGESTPGWWQFVAFEPIRRFPRSR